VWNIADQCLSSLATFVVTILAARSGTAEAFGHFAVGLTVYLFLLGVSQALVNQVFIMRYPAASDADAARAAGGAAGLAVLFGVACAVVIIPAGLLLAGGSGPALVAVAAVFPLLFLQDACRGVLIARGRPRAATVNDLVRVVLQIGVLCAVIAENRTAPAAMLAAWGLATLPAAVLGVVQVGARPSARAGVRFLRQHADISRFLVSEWIMVLGAAQVALLVVAWLGTTAQVGALRGAQTLLGPMNILGLGVFSFLLRELVRHPLTSPGSRRRFAAAVGGALAVASLLWGGVLMVLPDRVGIQLLGGTWPATTHVLAPMTVYVAGAAAATGLLAVLRSAGDARSTFVVNTVLAPTMLLGVVIGELLGDVVGAAWGFAAATTLIVPLFWLRMERLYRRRPAADPAPVPSAPLGLEGSL
jgi:O-antigen/teichoic acid export membrane protein